jgi:hypothetical protein
MGVRRATFDQRRSPYRRRHGPLLATLRNLGSSRVQNLLTPQQATLLQEVLVQHSMLPRGR